MDCSCLGLTPQGHRESDPTESTCVPPHPQSDIYHLNYFEVQSNGFKYILKMVSVFKRPRGFSGRPQLGMKGKWRLKANACLVVVEIGANHGLRMAVNYPEGDGMVQRPEHSFGTDIKRPVVRGVFPGGPVAKTPCSQFRGPGFNPWPGN